MRTSKSLIIDKGKEIMIKKLSNERMFTKQIVLGLFIIINSFLCYGEAPGKPIIKEVSKDGYIVKLDLSSQVLSLELPEDKFGGIMKGKVKEKAAEIYPSLKSIPESYMNFISAALIAQKTKNFDDGLVGAVEYLCQNGADKLPGKREVLNDLLAILQSMSVEKAEVQANRKCQALIYAALILGGDSVKVDKKIRNIANDSIKVFLKKKLKSKPIGLYTWNETLGRIFQQDRFLQSSIPDKKEIGMMRKALYKDNDVYSAYHTMLTVIEKINNPFPPDFCDFRRSTEEAGKRGVYCFIPPSMAHETELIKRLYGGRPVPKKFSLIDALIQNIKSGKISLKPTGNSGWYDYKTYALEPFLLPERMIEAAKLTLGEKYKKELINLFKATLALSRETHIKSLEIALAGAAMPEPAIKIYPELTLEPVATYYLRLGRSYSFLRDIVEKYLSDSTLMQSNRFMPDGKSKSQENLLDELKSIESLMYGLFSITAEEIGLRKVSNILNRKADQVMEDKKLAQEWIETLTEDKDLYADNRVMVPVFYDVQRKKTKVWVVLGYSVKPLTINFDKNPSYTVIDKKGKQVQKRVEFHKTKKHLIYPVSAEVYTNKILNRKEFRALCDSLKTQKEILHAIKNFKK